MLLFMSGIKQEARMERTGNVTQSQSGPESKEKAISTKGFQNVPYVKSTDKDLKETVLSPWWRDFRGSQQIRSAPPLKLHGKSNREWQERNQRNTVVLEGKRNSGIPYSLQGC